MTATAATTSTTSTANRVHGLDALRGGALLLGIVLHSLLPFIADIPWLITDSVTTPAADDGVVVIHLFRMSLFMMLAGYFARLTLHRKGLRAFTVDRLRRIGLPVIAFWPLAVLPIGILAVVGADVRGQELPQAPPSSLNPVLAALDPGHLWFLVVLLQIYVIALAVRAVVRRILGAERATTVAERAGTWLSGPLGVLLTAVPYAVAVLLQGAPVDGGIHKPLSVLPEAEVLAAYASAFAVGYALHARPDALIRMSRGRWVHLAVAVVTSLAVLYVIPTGNLAALAPVAALASAAWCYALTGLCVRYLNAERPAARYLADASYWMYLMHLPLLIAVEIPLADLALPVVVKLLITWLVTFVVLVLSYHVLVRSTWVGAWLNGRRHPWTWPPMTTGNRPRNRLPADGPAQVREP
ncbi:acyltransferase family protein [Promicromonospora sp. NPDC060271]|uniref:acyltransferase family protein n=1 Tax=Promicromonospora sp. NPDC060271 TaxID=3347089 RepID=UPI00366777F4